VETYTVVRRRGSHIFYTIVSQMAVSRSALDAGCPLPTEYYWYTFLLEAIVRLEGLGQLKYLMTSGIEPETFRLVA
jgi:hypothetical protein